MTTLKKFADILVKDVMTSHIQSVMVEDTIEDAINLMSDNGHTTLPVIDGAGKCIGILSRSDLTELFLREDRELSQAMDMDGDGFSTEGLRQSVDTCKDRKVNELMTYEVISIGMESKLAQACKIFAKKSIHHLPVIDENEKLVGIISTFDIVKAVAESE